MKKTDSIGLFKVSAPSTPAQWLRMTQHRFDMIKPHLELFSLERLGDVSVQVTEYTTMKLSHQNILVPSMGITFNTHGIFGVSDASGVNIGAKGSLEIWGITKKAEWISVSAEFIKADVKADAPGIANWVLSFHPGQIQITTLEKLIPLWKLSIWKSLGDQMIEWHTLAAKRHEVTRMLAEAVALESSLFQAAMGTQTP